MKLALSIAISTMVLVSLYLFPVVIGMTLFIAGGIAAFLCLVAIVWVLLEIFWGD